MFTNGIFTIYFNVKINTGKLNIISCYVLSKGDQCANSNVVTVIPIKPTVEKFGL